MILVYEKCRYIYFFVNYTYLGRGSIWEEGGQRLHERFDDLKILVAPDQGKTRAW